MELIFPKNIYCISCNEPISRKNKYSLCKNCYENIRFLKRENTNYDKEVIKMLDSGYIQDIKIATVYDDVMKSLIHKIKYSNKTYIAPYLAQILIDYIKYKNIEFDYISSTPIHKKRLRQRGYNQVDLIVNHISSAMRKDIIQIAKRVKETKDMYTLDLKSREDEMKNAFESKYIKEISGKTIIIIDDILTTGSTSLNLSKSIKKANKDINIKMLFLSRASLK